jgi:hypothetical protein
VSSGGATVVAALIDFVPEVSGVALTVCANAPRLHVTVTPVTIEKAEQAKATVIASRDGRTRARVIFVLFTRESLARCASRRLFGSRVRDEFAMSCGVPLLTARRGLTYSPLKRAPERGATGAHGEPMEIVLDKRAVRQIRLSALDAIEEGDIETLREDILEAFTEEQVEEIERRLDSGDFFEFLTDMLDEWSGDDADELFELIDTQLGDVGVDVKFERKAPVDEEDDAEGGPEVEEFDEEDDEDLDEDEDEDEDEEEEEEEEAP